MQPVAGSQLSVVQASPSSQSTGGFMQPMMSHSPQRAMASSAQMLSHSVSQQKGSVAHTVASHSGLSQPSPPLATQQLLGPQKSTVQASPSSQASGAFTQPVAESQLSTVQGLPSSQVTGVCTHSSDPASQLSDVQASKSSQVQSEQLSQFSPNSESQTPSPQPPGVASTEAGPAAASITAHTMSLWNLDCILNLELMIVAPLIEFLLVA
jgi:hypothetical protein